MKNLKFNIPLLLLIAYTLTSLVKGATISDGIIVISLCGIYGMGIWLSHTKLEIEKTLDPDIQRLVKVVEITRLQKEINALHHDMAKMETVQNVGNKPEKRTFTF